MSELHGRLLIEGELLGGRLTIEGQRIASVELDPSVEFEPSGASVLEDLPVIAPGFIDLHIHGFAMADPLQDLAGMANSLARAGTTAFLPTLFPARPELMGERCASFDKLAATVSAEAATPLGWHLEGPFVNPSAAGALPVADLAAPSVEALREILGSSTDSGRHVRNVTLAPELPGSVDLIEELLRCGIRVSMGHSHAGAAAARSAARAGAVGVTHLFNAMSGVHHRKMGLAGLALTEDLLYAEIIGDLVHVGREAFELALRSRGPAGLCLVSDALAGAGTGCDHFHLHGRDHEVLDGTAYYPADDQRPERQLAGSAMSQLEMVQRLVGRGVLGAAEAITMASTTPARALGIEQERGRLASGLRADLLVLEGESLQLQEVWVGGKRLS